MLAALFALSVAVFFFLLLRMVIRKKLERLLGLQLDRKSVV